MDTPAQRSQSNTSVTPPQSVVGGGISKEIEVGSPTVEAPGLKEIGQEAELPPDVTRVGVKVRPTTVNVPPPAASLGVTPVGAASRAAPAAHLPLTDDQIAQGLKQSLTSSWRWLAEWCRRKLKQLHKRLTKSQ